MKILSLTIIMAIGLMFFFNQEKEQETIKVNTKIAKTHEKRLNNQTVKSEKKDKKEESALNIKKIQENIDSYVHIEQSYISKEDKEIQDEINRSISIMNTYMDSPSFSIDTLNEEQLKDFLTALRTKIALQKLLLDRLMENTI